MNRETGLFGGADCELVAFERAVNKGWSEGPMSVIGWASYCSWGSRLKALMWQRLIRCFWVNAVKRVRIAVLMLVMLDVCLLNSVNTDAVFAVLTQLYTFYGDVWY